MTTVVFADVTVLLRAFAAALATFWLAQTIATRTGLAYCLARFRLWLTTFDVDARTGHERLALRELISCPYCVAPYVAMVVFVLVVVPSLVGDFILLFFAILGIQSLLQGVSSHEW